MIERHEGPLGPIAGCNSFILFKNILILLRKSIYYIYIIVVGRNTFLSSPSLLHHSIYL